MLFPSCFLPCLVFLLCCVMEKDVERDNGLLLTKLLQISSLEVCPRGRCAKLHAVHITMTSGGPWKPSPCTVCNRWINWFRSSSFSSAPSLASVIGGQLNRGSHFDALALATWIKLHDSWGNTDTCARPSGNSAGSPREAPFPLVTLLQTSYLWPPWAHGVDQQTGKVSGGWKCSEILGSLFCRSIDFPRISSKGQTEQPFWTGSSNRDTALSNKPGEPPWFWVWDAVSLHLVNALSTL